MGAHSIANAIRAEIIKGTYAHGSRLPTVREMMARHDVSQQTVASAYGMLADLGLVKTSRSSGTVVIAAPPGTAHLGTYGPADLSVADPWASSLGGEEKEETVSLRQYLAGPQEAAWGIPEGTSVIERVRMRTIDGTPAQHKTTILPYDVATRVPEGYDGVAPMLAPVGAPPAGKPAGVRMADWLGWDIAYSKVLITNEAMRKDATDMLGMPEGTPGHVITNVAWDTSGAVLYVTVTTAPVHHGITMTIQG